MFPLTSAILNYCPFISCRFKNQLRLTTVSITFFVVLCKMPSHYVRLLLRSIYQTNHLLIRVIAPNPKPAHEIKLERYKKMKKKEKKNRHIFSIRKKGMIVFVFFSLFSCWRFYCKQFISTGMQHETKSYHFSFLILSSYVADQSYHTEH